MKNNRIALLLGQADENYQSEFVRGVMTRAFENGVSVLVFSMYIKYQNKKEREFGDTNIYNLINYDLFDGIIILSDTIQTPGVEKTLEERINERFAGPVVCVDTDSEFFFSFWTDGYNSVYGLMNHLIEDHGMKDIAYLTGRKNHMHSKRRLEAYKDAMRAHGLEVREDRIFYGDFWYTSGCGCAETLLRDREHLPEAVMCANDCMAIGFAEEMEKRGLSVPRDIAVLGYGTSEEGRTCPKPLTSTYIAAEEYGVYSVDSLLKLMNNEEPERLSFDARLFIGESCGCIEENAPIKLDRRKTWQTHNSEEGYFSIHNFMMDDFSCSEDLLEMMDAVYENVFQLGSAHRFNIVLNDLWLHPDRMVKEGFPKIGYSSKVINALSYNADKLSEGTIGTDSLFERDKMLPVYEDIKPSGYIFTPLYVENQSFGYAMVSYGSEPRSYDEVYRLWIRDVSRGLEGIRRLMIIKELKRENEPKQMTKFSLNSDLNELSEVQNILNNNLFKYHFQPIVSAVDGEIFSYEALMRSATDSRIPPLQIIKCASELNRINDIEKATFINVLSIIQDNPEWFTGRKVFINSIPGCKLEYEDFSAIDNMLKKCADTAVVELTEQAELNDDELNELKQRYNRLRIGIAVDDYGTGYSNVGNLLRYMPDYVKIDRSLLSEIQTSSQKQHFVREVVEFCHANNIKALAEGVETPEELRTVINLGADLIQGYYLARPSETVVTSIDSNIKMEISRYHREKEDGSSDNSYIAGRVRRISIGQLIKEDKTSIVVGEKDSTFRDITIVGTPGTKSKIHIEILEGYDGRITLENVALSNIKNRPCIIMAENSNVTLCLVGENSFTGGGIKVPENSKLTMEGDGNLIIKLSASDIYGIGNTISKKHGLLEFYQDGEIHMELNGKTCIGIGSGPGGDVRIHRGKYTIQINGDEGVGIGSISGDNPLVVHDTDVSIDTTLYKGVCIGSVENSTNIEMWRSLIKCNGAGKSMALIGSVDGKEASVKAHDMSIILNVRSDYSTGVGCYVGHTNFSIDTAALRYNGMGKSAYSYGGCTDDTDVIINNSDIIVDINNEKGIITNAREDRISETYGRYDITVKDYQRMKDDTKA